MSSFKALVVREQDGAFVRQIEDRSVDDLPEGDVLIRVRYSSLNFKDALSATGNRGVTRHYPHTPGIDGAGEVVESSVSEWAPNDRVIVTGYDLGMNTSGGFGQFIRVPAQWIVRLPEGMTPRESMGYGTAGVTAALSVYQLEQAGVKPDDGEVLVTGATGGVGSLAVGMLAKTGYCVTAATGKTKAADFLKGLGAASVVDRTELDDDSGRVMMPSRWAGVVDTVGGKILATAVKSVKYGGAITCCGMVASPELQMTAFPFILRGVRLIGIDSAQCPMDMRVNLWHKMTDLNWLDCLDGLITDTDLDNLSTQIDRILDGQMRGRVVVNLE